MAILKSKAHKAGTSAIMSGDFRLHASKARTLAVDIGKNTAQGNDKAHALCVELFELLRSNPAAFGSDTLKSMKWSGEADKAFWTCVLSDYLPSKPAKAEFEGNVAGLHKAQDNSARAYQLYLRAGVVAFGMAKMLDGRNSEFTAFPSAGIVVLPEKLTGLDYASPTSLSVAYKKFKDFYKIGKSDKAKKKARDKAKGSEVLTFAAMMADREPLTFTEAEFTALNNIIAFSKRALDAQKAKAEEDKVRAGAKMRATAENITAIAEKKSA